jgi:hypothetical protein
LELVRSLIDHNQRFQPHKLRNQMKKINLESQLQREQRLMKSWLFGTPENGIDTLAYHLVLLKGGLWEAHKLIENLRINLLESSEHLDLVKGNIGLKIEMVFLLTCS